jgi:hypothetical protein
MDQRHHEDAEQVGDLIVASLLDPLQRSPALLVFGIHIRSLGNKEFCHLLMSYIAG